MDDLFVQLSSGLEVATTAVVALGVLIVGIALVYRGVDLAQRVIDKVAVDRSYREAQEEAWQEFMDRK